MADIVIPDTIPAAIRQAERRFGECEAVLDQGRRLSYAEFAARIRQTAGALLANGVGPGDRVCLWAPNRLEWMLVGLGAQYLGAVLVPLNTRYRGAEALDLLVRTRARLLVVDQRFLGTDYVGMLRAAAADRLASDQVAGDQVAGDRVAGDRVAGDRVAADRVAGGRVAGGRGPSPAVDEPDRAVPERAAVHPVDGLRQLATIVDLAGLGTGCLSWPDFLGRATPASLQRAEVLAGQVNPDDIADILFTSGTTGRSKGAMSSQRRTLGMARGWADRAQLSEEDRYLIVNPFFHSFGSKAGYLACLLTGALIVPHPVFDAAAVLDLVQRERITVLPGPPAIYQALLEDAGLPSRDLSSLRLAVTGAAMVPQTLIRRMGAELRIRCTLTAYGLTEAPVVTMCTENDDDETVATTCGRPLEWAEVRIAAPGGAAMPGEVLIRGPYLMIGYLDDPQSTAAAIDADGWLHTGDVGFLDERGYLRITDRITDMFTVGGFNVYPAELEQVISAHPAVRDCAVIGVPDQRLGEVGRAYVCTRPEAILDAEELIAYCRERLANFKVPRTVVLLDELPRNAGGKVVKPQLRQWALSGQ